MSNTPNEPDIIRAGRIAASRSGRHPAGRRLIARSIVTLAAAGMLAAVPGVASAHDTGTPHAHHRAEAELLQEEAPYCGPGFYPPEQYGGRCVQIKRLNVGGEPDSDALGVGLGVVFVLGAFIFG